MSEHKYQNSIAKITEDFVALFGSKSTSFAEIIFLEERASKCPSPLGFHFNLHLNKNVNMIRGLTETQWTEFQLINLILISLCPSTYPIQWIDYETEDYQTNSTLRLLISSYEVYAHDEQHQAGQEELSQLAIVLLLLPDWYQQNYHS